MAIEILLPKIEAAMNEGRVAVWRAENGHAVTEGQPLFSLEAGDLTDDVEAPTTGTLRIISRTGETYPVGTVLGYIEQV